MNHLGDRPRRGRPPLLRATGPAACPLQVGWTIAGGFKLLFRDRPWQPYLLCAYVVFVGHVFLGSIIDTDHWRHFYLLIGLVWGAMALEYRYQRGLLPGMAPTRSSGPGRPRLAPAAGTYAPVPDNGVRRRPLANRSLLGI